MRVSRILTWVFFVTVLFVITYSFHYSARARFGPLLVGIPTALLIMVQIVKEYLFEKPAVEPKQAPVPGKTEASFTAPGASAGPYLEIAACLVGLLAAIYVLGLLMAYFLFIIVYLKMKREGWVLSVAIAFGMVALIYGVFYKGLNIALYKGILFG